MSGTNRSNRPSWCCDIPLLKRFRKRLSSDILSLKTVSFGGSILIILLIVISSLTIHYIVERALIDPSSEIDPKKLEQLLSIYRSNQLGGQSTTSNQNEDPAFKEEYRSLKEQYNQLLEQLSQLQNSLKKDQSQGIEHQSNVTELQSKIPPSNLPKEVKEQESDPEVLQKRDEIKEAILHAWNSYKKYAWGTDELRPLSHSGKDWVYLGATIIDTLDLLIILDLKEEVKLARDWIEKKLTFEQDRMVSTFETTIRILGGLLSAYDLSGDSLYLEKAEDLGQRLLRSFDGSNPFPYASVNLVSGDKMNAGWAGGNHILSEIGTLQLEFLYLARKTNKVEYAQKALEVFKVLDEMPKNEDLYYLYVQSNRQWGSSASSLGGLGDSFYEYVLKIWFFTAQQVEGYRRMYDTAIKAVIKKMIIKAGELSYLVEYNGSPTSKMEHLTCFAGGMFALGAPDEEQLNIGAEITKTCHEMYKQSATGLGPESIFIHSGGGFSPQSRYYILRPETVESYFYLWRKTHNPQYREWAWEAFQAINKYCRVDGGYSGIRDITNTGPGNHDDVQQTFLLAETFKYLYLTFSDDSVISLDKYVFNTEAHPLSIFEYNDVAQWGPEWKSLFPPDSR